MKYTQSNVYQLSNREPCKPNLVFVIVVGFGLADLIN